MAETNRKITIFTKYIVNDRKQLTNPGQRIQVSLSLKASVSYYTQMSLQRLLIVPQYSFIYIFNLLKFSIYCGKFLKRWECKTTLPVSWETCMQVKKQYLQLDMKQWTGSKLGKEYVKAVYCHSASSDMQSKSCKMPG